jgi:hypothetical protein
MCWNVIKGIAGYILKAFKISGLFKRVKRLLEWSGNELISL